MFHAELFTGLQTDESGAELLLQGVISSLPPVIWETSISSAYAAQWGQISSNN